MQSLKQRFILAAKLLSLGKMKTSFLLLSLNRNIASRNRDKKHRPIGPIRLIRLN